MSEELLYFIPGFMQGITRVTISYPFDVIKVNMQTNKFDNTINTIKYLLKNDIFRFYRGSTFSYVSVSLERSIQFYFMEKLNKKNNNPYLNSFIISIFNSIYNIPVQYITSNIAISKKKVSECIKDIIVNNKNIYKGSLIEISRTTINSSIFMGTYFNLRNYFGTDNLFVPLYGSVSGIMCWIITYPIDTIRTEFQTTKNENIKQLVLNRYRNYGIRSFYKGLNTVLIRTIPSASIGMYVYEKCNNYIKLYLK
jgi:Mitochondrial carrier protein